MQYAAAGRAAPHFETEARGANTAAPAYAPRLNVPADFDADNFIRNAKVNFLRLQAANGVEIRCRPRRVAVGAQQIDLRRPRDRPEHAAATAETP